MKKHIGRMQKQFDDEKIKNVTVKNTTVRDSLTARPACSGQDFAFYSLWEFWMLTELALVNVG